MPRSGRGRRSDQQRVGEPTQLCKDGKNGRVAKLCITISHSFPRPTLYLQPCSSAVLLSHALTPPLRWLPRRSLWPKRSVALFPLPPSSPRFKPHPYTLVATPVRHAAAAAATTACIPHIYAAAAVSAADCQPVCSGRCCDSRYTGSIVRAEASRYHRCSTRASPCPSPLAPPLTPHLSPLPLQFAYLHQTLNFEPKLSLLLMQLAGLRTSSPQSARTQHSRPSRVSAWYTLSMFQYVTVRELTAGRHRAGVKNEVARGVAIGGTSHALGTASVAASEPKISPPSAVTFLVTGNRAAFALAHVHLCEADYAVVVDNRSSIVWHRPCALRVTRERESGKAMEGERERDRGRLTG